MAKSSRWEPAESHWHTNNLLRALRADDFALLKPLLVRWEAKPGTVIYEPGDEVKFAYFPCGSTLLSYMVMLNDGRGVETARIGREGAAGGIVSNGFLPAYARLVVQFGGHFLRIDTVSLENVKLKSLSLRHLFARYSDALIAQVFQSVACNAAHTIEQRAARWILASIDRTDEIEIPMTQEQLAGMLGVGRSYVNRVIQSLKQQGILDTSRGRLCVSDVKRLNNIACECTGSIRHHFEEVLKGVYPGNGDC